VGFCFFYYRSLTLIDASAHQRQSEIKTNTAKDIGRKTGRGERKKIPRNCKKYRKI